MKMQYEMGGIDLDEWGISTQIIAASIRSSLHVIEAAQAGAEIATLPIRS